SDLFFNYADSSARRSPEPILLWFSSRFGRPDWLHGERDRWQRLLSSAQQPGWPTFNRMLPLALLWMNKPIGDSDIQLPLNWQSGGRVPIAVHRSSWSDPNATFIGLKGGSPSASHGHMDAGSFVLDSDGQRWAVDLGKEDYNAIESRGMDLWNSSQNSD